MNRVLLRLGQMVLAVACVWLLATTLYASIRYLRPGPVLDFWGALPFLRAVSEGPWSWALFWEITSGAHRLVIPRLFFWLDFSWGSLRQGWLLALAWLALAGSAGIVLYWVWRALRDAQARWLAVFLVVFGLGSAHQLLNLIFTFNLQWTWSVLFALLSITALIKADGIREQGSVPIFWYLLAVMLSVALVFTTFSLPSLLMVWIALSWFLGWPRRVIVIGAVVLFLFALWYLSTMPWLNDFFHLLDREGAKYPGMQQQLHFYGKIVINLCFFVLVYLGSPLSEHSLWLGSLLGAVSLVWLLSVAHVFPQASTHPSVRALLCLCLAYAGFVLGMALSTALGRGVIDVAFNPRFRTVVMPFLVMAGLMLVVVSQYWSKTARFMTSVLLLALSLAVVLPGHVRQIHEFSGEYDHYMRPMLAMAAGLEDPAVVHESLWPMWWQSNNDLMMPHRDFMRDRGVGIFGTLFYRQMNTEIAVAEKLHVAHETIKSLPGGGYLWQGHTDRCGRDGRVAVVDMQGRVLGTGMVMRALPNRDWRVLYQLFQPLCRPGHPRAWTAYLSADAQPNAEVMAVVFEAGKPLGVGTASVPKS